MLNLTSRTGVLALLLVIFSANGLYSQTFQGTVGHINDDGSLNDFTAEVQGLTPEELTPQHGLISVCINLTHSWVADLDIRLISPSGKNILLTTGLGGDGDAYMNTCFRMDAPTHIITSWWPFTGDFIPFSNMGNMNDGEIGNGTWTLRILDTYPFADEGNLLDWQITFGDNAAAPDSFDSSNLPLILVTTDDNRTIPDEPKIPATLKLIDNGP